MTKPDTVSLDQQERFIELSLIEYMYWFLAGICLLICFALCFLWFGSDGGIIGFIVGLALPGVLYRPKDLYKQKVGIRIDRRQIRERSMLKNEPVRRYSSEIVPMSEITSDENPLERAYYSAQFQ